MEVSQFHHKLNKYAMHFLIRLKPETTDQYVQAGGREADPGAGGYSDHGANIRVQCRPGYTLQDTQRWDGVLWCRWRTPELCHVNIDNPHRNNIYKEMRRMGEGKNHKSVVQCFHDYADYILIIPPLNIQKCFNINGCYFFGFALASIVLQLV